MWNSLSCGREEGGGGGRVGGLRRRPPLHRPQGPGWFGSVAERTRARTLDSSAQRLRRRRRRAHMRLPNTATPATGRAARAGATPPRSTPCAPAPPPAARARAHLLILEEREDRRHGVLVEAACGAGAAARVGARRPRAGAGVARAALRSAAPRGAARRSARPTRSAARARATRSRGRRCAARAAARQPPRRRTRVLLVAEVGPVRGLAQPVALGEGREGDALQALGHRGRPPAVGVVADVRHRVLRAPGRHRDQLPVAVQRAGARAARALGRGWQRAAGRAGRGDWQTDWDPTGADAGLNGAPRGTDTHRGEGQPRGWAFSWGAARCNALRRRHTTRSRRSRGPSS